MRIDPWELCARRPVSREERRRKMVELAFFFGVVGAGFFLYGFVMAEVIKTMADTDGIILAASGVGLMLGGGILAAVAAGMTRREGEGVVPELPPVKPEINLNHTDDWPHPHQPAA